MSLSLVARAPAMSQNSGKSPKSGLASALITVQYVLLVPYKSGSNQFAKNTRKGSSIVSESNRP